LTGALWGFVASLSDSPPKASSRPPRRPLIIIADDDRITRELLASILRANAYEVDTVADGQQAVERVAKGGADLVLLDVMMPKMTGLEACRIIKGMTDATFLPILLVTVKTDPASRIEGLKIGADDYVCKPFEEGELLARVQAMLRIKRFYDELQTARARLERVSVYDELTGLFNYRYLNGRLGEEFKRAERSHEPLACALIDIDRLRVWNERGGRAFGDSILRGAADLIKKSVREVDIVVRYGGDEFLVLLPMTHFAGAVSVAERIWREVTTRAWMPLRDTDRVTLSVGIALFPSRDVRTKDTLLKAAEHALHRAKRDGMNRVCVFQQEGVIMAPTLHATPPSPDIGSGGRGARSVAPALVTTRKSEGDP
jgi:two-component system, cell cycle response regulator